MQKTILSTADVARLFNVTETTVKRWADDGTLRCQKTPGGHRKFQMRHIVEFATINNFEPIGALQFEGGGQLAGKIEVAVLSRNFPALQEAFVEKALSPDRTDLYQFFSYLYQHHLQLWEIYDLILGPGMQEIGNRWERGEIGVNHEHRASYETLDALAKLQAQVSMKGKSGHSAICACLEDELHEIGLRCAAYLFEVEGWHVQYLGARTPHQSLLAAIKEVRPDVVCISSTTMGDLGHSVEVLQNVHEAAVAQGAHVLLGGRAVMQPLPAQHVSSVVYRSSKQLVDFIQNFRQE